MLVAYFVRHFVCLWGEWALEFSRAGSKQIGAKVRENKQMPRVGEYTSSVSRVSHECAASAPRVRRECTASVPRVYRSLQSLQEMKLSRFLAYQF